jgi:hypothetical protein
MEVLTFSVKAFVVLLKVLPCKYGTEFELHFKHVLSIRLGLIFNFSQYRNASVLYQNSDNSYRTGILGSGSTMIQVLAYEITLLIPVLRIRIHRIHMFLGLLDPDPDPLVRGMDPDPDPEQDPDPSIIMQK